MMQHLRIGHVAHCAARFVYMQAVAEFALGRKQPNFGEIASQLGLFHINHTKLLHPGRVDNPGVLKQLKQLSKGRGMLPLVVGLRNIAGAQR